MKTFDSLMRCLAAIWLLTLLSACSSGSSSGSTPEAGTDHTVTTRVDAGGTINPTSRTVSDGATTTFTVTPASGSGLFADVSGCDGSLSGDTYTTGPITGDCEVAATFATTPPVRHTITTSVSTGGTINPTSRAVSDGATTTFTVTPLAGYETAGVTGCNGNLAGNNNYATGRITGDCEVTATFSAITTTVHTVTTSAGAGGTINPTSRTVSNGATTTFTVTPDTGLFANVSGCGGSLSGDTYTTGPITGDCTVTATFTTIPPVSHTVSVSAGSGGTIDPDTAQQVNDGGAISFTVTPDSGFFASVSGCGGTLSGDIYTTAVITADCSVEAVFTIFTPSTLTRSYEPIKLLRFTWTNAPGATHYRLLENPNGISGFAQVGGDIAPGAGGTTSFDHQVPLYARVHAEYMLQSCVNTACYDSGPIFLSAMAGSVGHLKASNASLGDRVGYSVSLNQAGDIMAVGAPYDASGGAVYVFTRNGCSGTAWCQQGEAIRASNADPVDRFGWSVSLNDTGDTLAVGAPFEDSLTIGVNTPANGPGGGPTNNDAEDAGAVYVFTRIGTTWSQQAYIKASNTGGADSALSQLDKGDEFGYAVSLSGTGDTLAVGAPGENSASTEIGFGQTGNTASDAGAVYVFTRIGCSSSTPWCQQAYIKASNTDSLDEFGGSVSLSGTGDTLAVGAEWEDSAATDIDGDKDNNSADQAGAVYVFTRNSTNWSQQAYIKASNTDGNDHFGASVSLDGAGNTLAVGAWGEDSSATGVNGNDGDDSLVGDPGAVYVFGRSNGTNWNQLAYIKASNPDSTDQFGRSVSLSDSGNTLAVGAPGERNASSGVYHNTGNQTDNSLENAGAVYVYTRPSINGNWSHQAYVKASPIGTTILNGTTLVSYDYFGQAVSFDGAGETLAVGAYQLYSDGAVFLY